MKKGGLVEVQGRISVNAYLNKEGDAKASMNFHVNSIKLHGKSNTGNAAAVITETTAPLQQVTAGDDLPF